MCAAATDALNARAAAATNAARQAKAFTDDITQTAHDGFAGLARHVCLRNPDRTRNVTPRGTVVRRFHRVATAAV